MIYIVMGVSGVGKTTIGKLFAEKLELPFYDADDFHSREHVRKMKENQPLTDEDRNIWLGILAEKIKEWNAIGGAVLACSALREIYRKKLRSINEEELIWIYLHSEYDVILQRISKRKGHYFGEELLQSQYKILESPEYGVHINVNTSIDEILKNIMKAVKKISKSEIGLIGLGVMGKSLALNLASRGINISVYNRQVKDKEVDIAKNFAGEHEEKYDFAWFDQLPNLVASLARPRVILLMVNAGKPVDMVIESLLPFLDVKDMIIDGGNSFFRDTIRREKELREKGIFFIGLGISGGEEGALKGPSLMPGGSKEAYEMAGPLLEKIAAKDKKAAPCCGYLGPDGAGHFIKMLHNGIEYGEMQLIAEIYHFLRFHTGSGPQEISAVFEAWNKEIESYLLGVTIEILNKKEGEGFLIDNILDAAKQKGTGSWSSNIAMELGVPFDTITAAVIARQISSKKDQRLKAGKAYNQTFSEKGDINELASIFFKAYRAGSLVNHAIGFDLLKEASENFNWDLDLSEISRVWTNGCIIRSGLMEELVWLFKENPEKHLLLHPHVISRLKEYSPFLIEAVSVSLKAGIPMSVLSAAANYFLSFTSGQSSANMIQAQRDFFGAHTFERTDRPRGTFFHAQWSQY